MLRKPLDRKSKLMSVPSGVLSIFGAAYALSTIAFWLGVEVVVPAEVSGVLSGATAAVSLPAVSSALLFSVVWVPAVVLLFKLA